VAQGSRFCPHLHLPLQAGEDLTLSRMRRRYTAEYFRERVERVLTASASPTDRYLDRQRLQQAYDDCVAGKQGDEFMLWKMMILERWLCDEAQFHAETERARA